MKRHEFFQNKSKFFVDDLTKIKEYVLKNCTKNDIETIIQKADAFVEQSFVFDLRWDMEYTVIPEVFSDTIHWLHQPSDDPEWTFAFNRHHYWITLGQAYVLTGDEKYTKAFLDQCLSWITQVSFENPEHANAVRTIETGLRLHYWIKALCLFEESPLITDEFCSIFEESIIQQQYIIYHTWNSTKIISNWGVLENHGLFVSCCLMPNHKETSAMLALSIERLWSQLQHQVYPDGVHWEQSTMYHNEVAQNYLEVVYLANNLHIELPAGFSEKVEKMIVFCAQHKKPDGIQIAMGDSDDIDVRDIITKGAVILKNPCLKHEGYQIFDFDCIFDLGYKASKEYEAMPSIPFKKKVMHFVESGNVFYHSEYKPNQTYLHFYNGVHGGGHAHEDKLHIDLFYNGEDILRDAGRYTYVYKPERTEFKGPEAHNIITIDNQPSIVCKSSWGFSKLAQSINTKVIEKNSYVLMEGATTGYMDLETGGVLVNRKIIVLNPELILINDEIYAGINDNHVIHQYFNFSPNAKVSIKDNFVLAEGEKSKVELHSMHDAIQLDLIDARTSLHYNTTEPSKRLVTTVNAQGFVSIFTVISLNKKDAYNPVQIERIPISFHSRKDRPFDTRIMEAISIKHNDHSYQVAMSHQDHLGPSDALCCENKYGIGQVIIWSDKDHDEWGTTMSY